VNRTKTDSKIQTLPPAADKASAVRRMFGAIAPHYDFLNHFLSFNRDRFWRSRAVDKLLENGPHQGRILDACAGTLDLAVELAARPGFQGLVVATDFSLPMLNAGAPKKNGLAIATACGDALQQPFRDSTFDGAMVAFGVRNLASVEGGLREFARLIRPGGKLVILEFATPYWRPFRTAYFLYFQRVLPLVGRLISRHDSAYSYLPASVMQFAHPAALAVAMERAGFSHVHWDMLTGGVVAVHVGTRRHGV
jgi:demethylmenaquinone methyltransferase / 2-methoxy-6-polyprenyl-1,4-benzoquinol methylase